MLVRDLRGVRVNTNMGMVRLDSCVCPNLDSRFDQDPKICLPTLDLDDYSGFAGQRLKHFLISVTADADFYLKCLEALRRQAAPPHGTVTRLYEKIQSHYSENKNLIL